MKEIFLAISLSFKHGQNLHFWRFLCSQRGEKNAPTVLLRHIQFWTLPFCICNFTRVSTLYWGRWRRIYISEVKYGLREWPGDDGYNVDVS